MTSHAKEILLLAAEDAFEFERFREAGPLTADVDPEVTIAEIAEFEALGIPLPGELESLRRELEHAARVREAIRAAAGALRRSARAEAGALVALGQQPLVARPSGWEAGGAGGPGGVDPRLLAMMDPRFVAAVSAAAQELGAGQGTRAQLEAGQGRGAAAELVDARGPVGAVDAEVLAEPDGDWEGARGGRAHDERGPARRPRANRPRAREDDWDEDEDEDEDFESLIAARPSSSPDKTTWILGGIAGAAVLGLVWMLATNAKRDDQEQAAAQQQAVSAQAQVSQPPAPAPAQAPPPTIDPALAPPPAQAMPSQAPPPQAPRPRRGGGGGRAPGASAPAPSGGGANPFGGYTPPGKDIVGGQTQPAAGGTQPAGGGTQPAAGGSQPAAGGTPAGTQPAPAATQPTEAATQPTVEGKVPSEAPKAAAPEITKSKMTPAQRSAITSKVGGLQQCYQDALVGKPDLAGRVVFTISLDQDGVVKRVDVTKDEVKYGVAKCSAKKIKTWILPGGGIPMVFDLPFDFKQP
ncbi:AgmX/PglI C-terminal domain-containing protein [Pseudenhygromyxa sp. WMMC2535]|uniref:AgmX/PglI C-terminal domain-containing protein n=1 Tax=Pseudenhygromyxa sp. WMMC2535 TaxID=2712867 RepID=UPI001553880C|nr:AgmX/PglI C-terminal domain-containing protein [Pseudenhygromyxa sp. WMMC2535]NVB43256.1 AgmX/PglI C-terminal domain-containing protein [Pseudenhygromyxa sp. WMMC2535]